MAAELARQQLHDLNSALQVVTGNIELLQLTQSLPAPQQQMLAAALKAAEQAAALVRALQTQA